MLCPVSLVNRAFTAVASVSCYVCVACVNSCGYVLNQDVDAVMREVAAVREVSHSYFPCSNDVNPMCGVELMSILAFISSCGLSSF